MKNVISVTEARKQIFKLVEDVNTKRSHFLLTEKGRAKAVIMSAEEFESWEETLEVYWDIPDLAKDIKEAEADFAAGNYITLDELMAERGYVLSDKKVRYDASSRNSKKRTKKAV